MDFPSTSEIEIKSFTDLSIFDGLGSNFKKHLDANFAKGGSDDKTDSLFIESVVINNDINLEDELIKAKDEDESAFKILSISFYDKKTPTISNKTQNNSPLRSEENNKVFTLRPSPKNRNLIPKTGSQPSLTPFVGEIAVNALKDNRLGSPKLSIKTDVKLFSIKEKVNKLNISPQITPQKPHFAPGVLGSPIEKSRSHAVLKDLPKPEREAIKPQRPNSPRKESISREASAEKKLSTLDLKISAMIKSKSPGNTIKKSSSKERIFASPQRVTFSVSPKGFKFHPKIEVAVEKVKISRESSEKKISMSNARNEKEESPMRNQSPAATFSLNKTILARRFDLQRVSLNNVNYSSTKDLHAKESRTPSKAMQRQEAGSQQTPTPKQVKVDLARGYRSNQSFYSKVASRRGSNNEQQKNSKILGQKLRINTEENSATKISVKDLCDMSVQVQGSRSVKGKMRGIDFSTMKQRDNTFSAGKDMFDIQKPSLKSQQSKAKLKETLTKDVDLAKKKNPVLPLQCRTFDI